MHISYSVRKGSPFIFVFISKEAHKITKSLNSTSAHALWRGEYGKERESLCTPHVARKDLTAQFLKRVEPLSEVRVRAGPTVENIEDKREMTSCAPSVLHLRTKIKPKNLSKAINMNLKPSLGGTEK